MSVIPDMATARYIGHQAMRTVLDEMDVTGVGLSFVESDRGGRAVAKWEVQTTSGSILIEVRAGAERATMNGDLATFGNGEED